MTLRTWLQETLRDDAVLDGLIGGRVFQGGSMTSRETPKPYVVHHIGNHTSENLSETDPTSRRFFQLYVHDEPGDYSKIDEIGERIIYILHGAQAPDHGLQLIRFLERSQDLDDEVMRTIFNYLRFQAIQP